jgi:hypothetical protein
MSKCNVCDRADSLTPHPYILTAWLCPDHAVTPKSSKSIAPLNPPERSMVIDFNRAAGKSPTSAQ